MNDHDGSYEENALINQHLYNSYFNNIIMQGNDTFNESYSWPQGYDNSSFIRQP